MPAPNEPSSRDKVNDVQKLTQATSKNRQTPGRESKNTALMVEVEVCNFEFLKRIVSFCFV